MSSNTGSLELKDMTNESLASEVLRFCNSGPYKNGKKDEKHFRNKDKLLRYLEKGEKRARTILIEWLRNRYQDEMTAIFPDIDQRLYDEIGSLESSNIQYGEDPEQLDSETKKDEELSKEEIIEAENVIKKGDSFEYVFNTIKKRHVGEEMALVLLMFSGASSGMMDRKRTLHVMAVGGSGKGKTDAMTNVLKVFTEHERVVSSSPMAMFYKAQKGKMINGGIIFFPENDTKGEFLNALERIMTDREDSTPSHETVIRNGWEKLEIKEINALWRNSVYASEDEDNQLNNRYFMFNVDESIDQDNYVFNHIINSYGDDKIEGERDLRISRYVTSRIKEKPCKVKIPFRYYIDADPSMKRDRRTIVKFLMLIEASAYFNRFNRVMNENETMILADMQDFAIAQRIWKSISRQEMTKRTATEDAIIQAINSHNTSTGEYARHRDIVNITKINRKNVSETLAKLEQKGEVNKITTKEGSHTYPSYDAGSVITGEWKLNNKDELKSFCWYPLVSNWQPSANSQKGKIWALESLYREVQNVVGIVGKREEGFNHKEIIHYIEENSKILSNVTNKTSIEKDAIIEKLLPPSLSKSYQQYQQKINNILLRGYKDQFWKEKCWYSFTNTIPTPYQYNHFSSKKPQIVMNEDIEIREITEDLS